MRQALHETNDASARARRRREGTRLRTPVHVAEAVGPWDLDPFTTRELTSSQTRRNASAVITGSGMV
jgi:hypothetical protein